MCIALYYLNSQGKYRFVLLFNREEFSDRPTDKMKIIVNDGSNIIIGGQDKLQSGTWLAVNISNGAIAFLTNRNELFSPSLYQSILQCKNRLRFRFSKVMKYFYPALKSRGQLIMDMVKRTEHEEKLEFTYELQNQQLRCNYKNKADSDPKGKLMQAYLNREHYMGFNLFVGNMFTQDYYTLSSYSKKFLKVNQSGTACSFSNVGDNQLEKEILAKEKFIQIIETDTDIDTLFKNLFALAQEQIESREKLFRAFPHEAKFFIPEYTTNLGRKRGTRTTTIIVFGESLEMREKTYI